MIGQNITDNKSSKSSTQIFLKMHLVSRQTFGKETYDETEEEGNIYKGWEFPNKEPSS